VNVFTVEIVEADVLGVKMYHWHCSCGKEGKPQEHKEKAITYGERHLTGEVT